MRGRLTLIKRRFFGNARSAFSLPAAIRLLDALACCQLHNPSAKLTIVQVWVMWRYEWLLDFGGHRHRHRRAGV